MLDVFGQMYTLHTLHSTLSYITVDVGRVWSNVRTLHSTLSHITVDIGRVWSNVHTTHTTQHIKSHYCTLALNIQASSVTRSELLSLCWSDVTAAVRYFPSLKKLFHLTVCPCLWVIVAVYVCTVKQQILRFQSPTTGLFPADLSQPNSCEAHVRDSIYCAVAVWSLAQAYKYDLILLCL